MIIISIFWMNLRMFESSIIRTYAELHVSVSVHNDVHVHKFCLSVRIFSVGTFIAERCPDYKALSGSNSVNK